MPDLDAAIREWFSKRLEVMPLDEDIQLHESLQMAAHATIAVLDLHRAAVEDFTHVDETVYEFARRSALEDAVNAIAEKLGISLTG